MKEDKTKTKCTHPNTYVAVRHAESGTKLIKCRDCNSYV